VGSPTASSFVTAIKVSSLPAASFSSSSLEVGVKSDYLIEGSSTSGLVKELISALFGQRTEFSLAEIFRYRTGA